MTERTDDEVRAIIAEWMGFTIGGLENCAFTGHGFPGWNDIKKLPDYLTDLNAVAAVEAELERRGLHTRYVISLLNIVGDTEHAATHVWYADESDFWKLATATARQRCTAILAVIETRAPAGEKEG